MKPFVSAILSLFLGLWAGAMLMTFIAAAITFPVLKSYAPLPGVPPLNDPVFAQDGWRILAGGVVGRVLLGLDAVQAVCAAVAIMCLAIQRLFGAAGLAHWLRVAFLASAIGIGLVNALHFAPHIWELRAAVYDPQRSPEARLASRQEMQAEHRTSQSAMFVSFLCVGAAIVSNAYVRSTSDQPT